MCGLFSDQGINMETVTLLDNSKQDSPRNKVGNRVRRISITGSFPKSKVIDSNLSALVFRSLRSVVIQRFCRGKQRANKIRWRMVFPLKPIAPVQTDGYHQPIIEAPTATPHRKLLTFQLCESCRLVASQAVASLPSFEGTDRRPSFLWHQDVPQVCTGPRL